MTEDRWTPTDLPNLAGVRAVVTGANSGLGYWTSLELARHGAHVVMACRTPAKGEDAARRLRAQVPEASVEVATLDLADLASVRRLASQVTEAGPLGLLVNNAGVMATPRRRTADGFELQLGTNHLGHFALTGLVMPALLAAAGGPGEATVAAGPARVVTVSSAVHRMGRLHRDDLMLETSYSPWRAYGQSKLANLLFMRELQRRADDSGARVASLAAHPGYAATNLQQVGPQMAGNTVSQRLASVGNRLFAQSAEHGAWPSLRACGDRQARTGEYFGPGGFAEQRGHPRRVGMTSSAMDPQDAAWLWQRSIELTGVDFAALARH